METIPVSSQAASKLKLSKADADFDQYTVFIHGVLQDPKLVVSADAINGKVWRYQVDAEGNILPKRPIYSTNDNGDKVEVGTEPDYPQELATGTVMILPKQQETT